MELIVVIVILAILAAILIPGLLKWIDQAKDKKYELEAREIALAAEGALTKVYANGREVYEWQNGLLEYAPDVGGTGNFMGPYGPEFEQEIKKLTDADVRVVRFYSKGYTGGDAYRPWEGGSVTGFIIYFVASDNVKICATLRPPITDGWEIEKIDSGWPFE